MAEPGLTDHQVAPKKALTHMNGAAA